MRLDTPTVSGKTPKDGRLEISHEAAAALRRLASDPASVPVVVEGLSGTARLDSMACTCRGPEAAHEHVFLASDLLKRLRPGTAVTVDFDSARGVVTIA
jgi:hypothetical protein